MTELTLKGKNAIVSGGSRGIGKGIALDFARRGANVVVTYSSPNSKASVDDLVQQVAALDNGTIAHGIQSDLRDLDEPAKVIREALSKLKKSNDKDDAVIDILVNNAAFLNFAPLSQITPEQFDEVYAVNVRGTLFFTQAVLPYIRRPGRIINISSVGARMGIPEMSLYASSKAALNGLTRTWAAELGGDGTTVNSVCPGPVKSEMLDKVDQDMVKRQKEATAIEKRVGNEDDIAGTVSFLASESSRWITGQTISTSGGFAMY